MLHIREAIVVEGRYDKNTLFQVVDTVILETGTEKDVEKIRALWKDGYDEGMERLDEVQAFLSGS